jgi:putative membrane protein
MIAITSYFMKILMYSLIVIVALIHVFFLTQQMFQWDKGRKRFDNFSDGQIAKVLASNQGLYNGFLAAGMVWGWLSPANSVEIWTFFLSFIAIAGIYGSVTLTVGSDSPNKPYQPKPLAIIAQTIPAIIALILVRSGFS